MDPEIVTVLALVALAVAGFTVAVTGVIHLRRSKAVDAPDSPETAAVEDEP